MIFLFACAAAFTTGLTAEHKRPDPAAIRFSGITIRNRQLRGGEKLLSLVATIARVFMKLSNEVKNTRLSEFFPAKLSNTGLSKAVNVNVPIVANTRHAVIA